MSFTQKIYYNNKPLLLTTAAAVTRQHPDYIVLEGATGPHFREALALLDKPEHKGVIITDTSKEQLEKELLWAFYPIHSGGGVVLNESGAVLMIYRRQKWDLPKGKQDEGEDIAACALREVQEETGLSHISITHRIGHSLHIYPMNQQMVLKYTTWYLMKGSSEERLLPQEEEKIEQAVWVRPADIPGLLHHSFETISDVLKEAGIL